MCEPGFMIKLALPKNGERCLHRKEPFDSFFKHRKLNSQFSIFRGSILCTSHVGILEEVPNEFHMTCRRKFLYY